MANTNVWRAAVLMTIVLSGAASVLGSHSRAVELDNQPDQRVRADQGRPGLGAIQFTHDSRPLPGIPREARNAGTVADQPPGVDAGANVTFRVATDVKNYGPLRDVMSGPLKTVRLRYFDSQAFNRSSAETFLRNLLTSQGGTTRRHVFWAEGLGIPLIEAYLYTDNASFLGHLLAWRGRVVYQDADGQWWFSA